MEWSEQRTLEFIELIHKEELIWNPRNKHHKNRQKVNDAWDRLAISLGMPVSVLKSKKNSLMACFRTQLRKKKSSLKSGMGAEDVYEPIWFAYKPMEDFLAPVYDCGDTIATEEKASSPSNEDNEEQSALDQTGNTDQSQNTEIIDHSEETDHRGTVHAQSSQDRSSHFPASTSQRHKRRQLTSEINDAQNKIQKTFETLNNVLSQKKDVENDDCDLYGKLLATKLKSYTKYERHVIMHEIDGLLLRKPPSTISNISFDTHSNSFPGKDPTDTLPQSPVHINTPNQPFTATFVDLSSKSPSPVLNSFPNRPTSAVTSYPFYHQSQLPSRSSSVASSYSPMSQSPIRIRTPSRSSSDAAFQSQFLTNRPSYDASNRMSQSPVHISIPESRPSSASTLYVPYHSDAHTANSTHIRNSNSNQIHILSEEVISPAMNILQHALTNAEIDDSDLMG